MLYHTPAASGLVCIATYNLATVKASYTIYLDDHNHVDTV